MDVGGASLRASCAATPKTRWGRSVWGSARPKPACRTARVFDLGRENRNFFILVDHDLDYRVLTRYGRAMRIERRARDGFGRATCTESLGARVALCACTLPFSLSLAVPHSTPAFLRLRRFPPHPSPALVPRPP